MLSHQMESYKASRDAHRSRQLRMVPHDRIKDKTSKSVAASAARAGKRSNVGSNTTLLDDTVEEATYLIRQPPVIALADKSNQSTYIVGLRAREVALVDLPIKPHRKTISSDFEIIQLPKIVALDDSVASLQNLSAYLEDADWEHVEGNVKPTLDSEPAPKPTYAAVLRV